MITTLDDGELGEMHVATTYAHHAGHTRVEIDPLHLLQLIDEVQLHRRTGAATSAELEGLRRREEMILPLVFKWTREAHHAAHCHEGDDYHLGYGAALRVAARDLDHALERDVITGERPGREGEDG